MCVTCNKLKLRGDVDGILALMSEMKETRPFTREQDKCYYLMDQYLGDIGIEDEETARLVIHRELGMPEPELYHDESPETYQGTEEELNRFIDLQERISKGVKKIQEANEIINKNSWAGYIYNAWAGRYDDAKNKQVLSDPRNKQTIQWIEYRDRLHKLKYELEQEAFALSRGNSIYPEYLKIIEDREDEQYDPIAHKRSAPEIDSRMLSTDEAYILSHLEAVDLERIHEMEIDRIS
jgi:hypothetical protein